MRSRALIRSVGACLAVVALLGVASCSDDDNGSGGGAAEQGGSGSEGSIKQYCDAAKEGLEIAKRARNGTMSEEDPKRFIELFSQASAATPAEIRRDAAAAFRGDPYAQDNVDLFMQEQCGVDVDELSTTTVPG
jgi:hypothetical protein